ncbi:unnamed protein product [Ascophyllum nodosum]
MKHPQKIISSKLSPCFDNDIEKQQHATSANNLLARLRGSKSFTMALLAVVLVLLYADQSLIAPNLSAVAEEFGLSDEEKDKRLGGEISVAFFGLGAPASLIAGWLADSVDRRKLFVAVVLLGQVGAMATAFTTTYSQLYWTRAITGIAIGGVLPVLFSILGDLVDTGKRTEASGAFGIAVGMGLGLGQVVAGLSGRATSLGWRFPFLLLSLPCVVLSLVVYVATTDPPRGRCERGLKEHFRAGGDYTERLNLNTLRLLASCPTLVLAMTQGIFGCIPGGVLSVYLNDFLQKQRGLTIGQATTILCVLKTASMAGEILGSKLGQLAYNRRPELQPLLMGTAGLCGVVPFVMLIRYKGDTFAYYLFYTIVGGVLSSITSPNIKTILMNVSLPSTRGMAYGIFNVFDDLGKGLGPALVSMIVAKRGRELAFTLAMLAWIPGGFIKLSLMCTVRRDEIKVQAHLKSYARTNNGGRGSQSSLSLPMSAAAVENYNLVTDRPTIGINSRVAYGASGDEEEKEGLMTDHDDAAHLASFVESYG